MKVTCLPTLGSTEAPSQDQTLNVIMGEPPSGPAKLDSQMRNQFCWPHLSAPSRRPHGDILLLRGPRGTHLPREKNKCIDQIWF